MDAKILRHLGTQGGGNLETGHTSPEKKKHRENGMLGCREQVLGLRQGSDSSGSAIATGASPAAPRPVLPVRQKAARALLGAARLEQSAHNEALSDVAVVPESAGGSRGGRKGRKEPVGPQLPLPSPSGTKGLRLGGGAAARWRAPESPG